MKGDYFGWFLVFVILGLFFAFGFGAGRDSYKHDTFDCTNTCGGKHSIQYANKACYCEAK